MVVAVESAVEAMVMVAAEARAVGRAVRRMAWPCGKGEG